MFDGKKQQEKKKKPVVVEYLASYRKIYEIDLYLKQLRKATVIQMQNSSYCLLGRHMKEYGMCGVQFMVMNSMHCNH